MACSAADATSVGAVAEWATLSCWLNASSRATRSEMSRSGSVPDASMPAKSALSMSVDANSAEARSLVKASSPSRIRPSRFSATWPTRSTSAKPKNPDVPLMVCIERKIAATLSGSWFDSRATSRLSMLSRFS